MRRVAGYAACIAGMALALSAAANAPDRSPRPELRPGAVANVDTPPAPPALVRVVVTGTPQAPARSVRPAPRGGSALPALPETPPAIAQSAPPAPAQPQAQALPVSGTRLATARSLRPMVRPERLAHPNRATDARNISASVAQPGQRGALCGQAGLVGERLDPIAGRSRGCGIAEPVRLRAVDGITLSTPATVNCETARALQNWVQRSVVPTVGQHGGGVRSLRVVASYACRTQNNQPGARISEHGRGNAIDIAGIGLADGSELTVLTDWRRRREGRILQQLHAGACGPFGTVLGPNSDRFHRDHFHFDVARHRSGPFCR